MYFLVLLHSKVIVFFFNSCFIIARVWSWLYPNSLRIIFLQMVYDLWNKKESLLPIAKTTCLIYEHFLNTI